MFNTSTHLYSDLLFQYLWSLSCELSSAWKGRAVDGQVLSTKSEARRRRRLWWPISKLPKLSSSTSKLSGHGCHCYRGLSSVWTKTPALYRKRRSPAKTSWTVRGKEDNKFHWQGYVYKQHAMGFQVGLQFQCCTRRRQRKRGGNRGERSGAKEKVTKKGHQAVSTKVSC